MGGGGAMRAAAKVAGIGLVNSGLRGAPAVTPAEHPLTAAARKGTRSVSAIVSSSDDVQLNGLVASQGGKIDASVQRPSWEIDDWEFAGGEEELIIGSGEPMPRLVFGGVPTLQEAKEATSELNEALEKAYLSPNSTGYGGLATSGQEPVLFHLSKSENSETRDFVTSETTVTASVPKHAIQAFRFLNETPAAQSVVASIASDPNVWNAVLQNEALVEFLQSHKTSPPFSDGDPIVKESVADYQNQQSAKCFDESYETRESPSGNGFAGFFQNIKVTVVEMMNNLSGYFQNLFGVPVTAGELSAEDEATARENFVDRALGASFMGLAVMVIMVVVLKRG